MKKQKRKRRARLFIGAVLIEVLILVIPICRLAEFTIFSAVTNGKFDRLFPTALGPLQTAHEALYLQQFGSILTVRASKNFGTGNTAYVIKRENGALLTTLIQQSVVVADTHYFFTICDFSATSCSLKAMRLSDGTVVWEHAIDIDTSNFVAEASVQNGVIYFLYDNGGTKDNSMLIAFSEDNGEQLWHHDMGNDKWEAFTFYHNRVYMLRNKGVEALGLKDGHTLWYHAEDQTRKTSIVADEMSIYLLGDTIISLRASDGQRRADFTLSGKGVDTNGNYIYIGSRQDVMLLQDVDEVIALKINNGSIVWSLDIRNRKPQDELKNIGYTFDGDLLYGVIAGETVGETVGDIYAFRVSDGKQAWHMSSPISTSSSFLPAELNLPVLGVIDRVLYVQYNGDVFAVQAQTGQVLWQTSLGSGNTIAMQGEGIYVGNVTQDSNIPTKKSFFSFALGSTRAMYYCEQHINLSAISARNHTVLWHKQLSEDCAN